MLLAKETTAPNTGQDSTVPKLGSEFLKIHVKVYELQQRPNHLFHHFSSHLNDFLTMHAQRANLLPPQQHITSLERDGKVCL